MRKPGNEERRNKFPSPPPFLISTFKFRGQLTPRSSLRDTTRVVLSPEFCSRSCPSDSQRDSYDSVFRRILLIAPSPATTPAIAPEGLERPRWPRSGFQLGSAHDCHSSARRPSSRLHGNFSQGRAAANFPHERSRARADSADLQTRPGPSERRKRFFGVCTRERSAHHRGDASRPIGAAGYFADGDERRN